MAEDPVTIRKEADIVLDGEDVLALSTAAKTEVELDRTRSVTTLEKIIVGRSIDALEALHTLSSEDNSAVIRLIASARRFMNIDPRFAFVNLPIQFADTLFNEMERLELVRNPVP